MNGLQERIKFVNRGSTVVVFRGLPEGTEEKKENYQWRVSVFEPKFEPPTSWTQISSATNCNAQKNWLYNAIKRKKTLKITHIMRFKIDSKFGAKISDTACLDKKAWR
jgi:hypothetical protein